MAYGDAFSDLRNEVCQHLKSALGMLVTRTWSATRDELRLSDGEVAEIKALRITATRRAEQLVADALKTLDPVSPDNEIPGRSRG